MHRPPIDYKRGSLNLHLEKLEKTDRTEILHHSQLAVGAGSPTIKKAANRLNKPARPHEKSPD
jgi:hypothetical protein